MELQYYGANSLRFTTKKSVIVVDPISNITMLHTDLKKVNTVAVTQVSLSPTETEEGVFIINGPGEYEFEDYSIKGIAAQAHTEPTGDKSATMYWLNSNDTRVLIVGHVHQPLTEEQLEAIGVVDVVIIPVGGGGYTLDAVDAAAMVRSIEPKLVIPVHASDDGLQYDVPQQAIELFVKELGVPVAEEIVEKYRFKTLPEQLSVQLIKKQ